MSGQSSGQTLWSSTSSGPPSSSSLTSNAQSIAGQGDNHKTNIYSDSVNVETSTVEPSDLAYSRDDGTRAIDYGHDNHQELGYKRHKLRHSSGFLLQPASAKNSQPLATKHTNLVTNHEPKGKRKIADGDLVIHKRGTIPRHHHKKTVVGGSPLATEVIHAAHTNVGHSKVESNREEILSVPSAIHSSSFHDRSGNEPLQPQQLRDDSERQIVPSAIGYGTDPAQIVNLALNLSESRRRNVSIGNSPPSPFGNRRISSLIQYGAGSPNGSSSRTGSGSLRYYLQPQRHASRNISPRSSKLQNRDISPQSSPRIGGSNIQHITTSTFNPGPTDETMSASVATLARAEKAKVAFTLFYEYRRLLSNLPAFSTHTKSKPISSRSSIKSIGIPEELGRVYNPLQYIRNRKLRYRQGRMLDSEVEGWMDVDKVKNWVDNVADHREAGTSALDEHCMLPPFEGTDAESNVTDPSVAPTRNIGLPFNRWSFTPWDLLADAYWVHQGNNINEIQDRYHKKLVPSEETPTTPPRTSKDIPSSPVRRSESVTRQTFTPERIQSLLKPSRNNSRERGRHQHRPHEPVSPIGNHNSSRDRRSRWARRTIRSRGSSSSGESYDNGLSGSLRDSGYFKGRDPESAALEKQMRDMLKKEFENDNLPETATTKANDNNKTEETHYSPDKKLSTTNTSDNANIGSLQDWKEVDYETSAFKKYQRSPRASVDEERDIRIRHSIDTPDSPILSHFHMRNDIPSIAIDSPPMITQNTAPKKNLSSWLASHRRNLSRERQDISERDFVTEPKELKIAQKDAHDINNQDLPSKYRTTISNNPLLSPNAAGTAGRKFRRPDGASTKSIRDSNDSESKLRGFFKGGRIAELVGNEVHKVGDKLWKKESMNNLSRVSTKSGYASDDSDLEADLSALDSSPEDFLSRGTTNQEKIGQLVQKPTAVDKIKNINPLSGFRSQHIKHDQSSDNLNTSSKDDHITRQQIAQRDRGRSSRFDRLAPPKIDVKGMLSRPSASMTRTRTRDTNISYSESHQSSGSASGTPVHAVDRRYNVVLGTPGNVGSSRPQVSILSDQESHQHRTGSRPGIEKQRQWSISDRGVSAVRGTVTKRDIARIQALLLSSGVKANEIVRRGHEVRESPSNLLQTLEHTSQRPLPHVPRSQEHLLAAHLSISTIESSTQQLRDSAETFSTTAVASLHERLRALDEHVTLKLTPAVRAAADEADLFSTRLTTAHTLAVKELSDSVAVLLRRRGRRFRWVRRAGYVLLEWALLGLMWWVWLIVVVVLLLRGMVRGFVRGVRWLVWM